MSGTAQSAASLYATFADSAGPGTLTPAQIRNLIASTTINVGSSLVGQVATGSGLATAFPISVNWIQFSTVAAGTGAVLPAASGVLGQEFEVWNSGANTLTVYAFSGDTINGAGSQTIAASAKLRMVAMNAGIWLLS